MPSYDDYHSHTEVDDLLNTKEKLTMLSKYYTNDSMSPYFNLFDVDPFKLADEIYGVRYSEQKTYRVETNDAGLDLSIDLPGVKSEDVSVKTVGREIRIEGRSRGREFKNVYTLSKSYDPNSVTAELELGVLTLRFKKTASTEAKNVEVLVK